MCGFEIRRHRRSSIAAALASLGGGRAVPCLPVCPETVNMQSDFALSPTGLCARAH